MKCVDCKKEASIRVGLFTRIWYCRKCYNIAKINSRVLASMPLIIPMALIIGAVAEVMEFCNKIHKRTQKGTKQ